MLTSTDSFRMFLNTYLQGIWECRQCKLSVIDSEKLEKNQHIRDKDANMNSWKVQSFRQHHIKIHQVFNEGCNYRGFNICFSMSTTPTTTTSPHHGNIIDLCIHRPHLFLSQVHCIYRQPAWEGFTA